MIRQNFNRIDPKRRNVLDHRKKQFADAAYKPTDYPHRMNFYSTPPTAEITLEQFEQWAIDRLRILAELEACSFRNKTPAETALHMKPLLDKYLPLEANSSSSTQLADQRQRDHYGHFILRLAFASTEDLRRRFCRVETMLFRLRLATDDARERAAFVASLSLDWDPVSEEERRALAAELAATAGAGAWKRDPGTAEEESWCKVDWGRVPDLVEGRRVFLKAGKAYVPAKEQISMVVAEFTTRLEKALELTARALPRLDEDDRLKPVLDHLSKNFITPDASYRSGDAGGPAAPGSELTAANVDKLAARHFPLCMQHLHRSLRRDAHLKHYGRLQYTLFLKGVGLSLEECLLFWRSSFHKITDDTFNKEYRYNVRYSYGDVGGDVNRRGSGSSPFSCQKILTEHPPGPGEAHGCPYRHFDAENLTALLRQTGVTEKGVLSGVRDDREKQKFHMACNRVFEHLHARELKRAKEEGVLTGQQAESIVHPNEYFKRSWIVTHLDDGAATAAGKGREAADVKMEG